MIFPVHPTAVKWELDPEYSFLDPESKTKNYSLCSTQEPQICPADMQAKFILI